MKAASALLRLMLAASIALALELVLWESWLAPLRPGGSMLVLLAVPAFAIVACVWKKNVYGLQVSSMLVLVYLAEGVVRAMTDKGLSALLGAIEIVLVTAFFVADLAYLRPFKRAARAKAQRP
jgi:uncharacterized membrane protein